MSIVKMASLLGVYSHIKVDNDNEHKGAEGDNGGRDDDDGGGDDGGVSCNGG